MAGPDDAIERAVAAAGAQALGGEPASLDDNFFDLGGTSLGLVRVQSLLRETFGRLIPVAALFPLSDRANAGGVLARPARRARRGARARSGAPGPAARTQA